jgi:hypothetical protein
VNGALVTDHPARLLLIASGTLLLGAATPCLLPGGDMTGRPVQDGMDEDGRGASVVMLNSSTTDRMGESYTSLQVQPTTTNNDVSAVTDIPYKDDPSQRMGRVNEVV